MFTNAEKDKKVSTEDIGRKAGREIGSAIGGALGKGIGAAMGLVGKASDAVSEKIDDAKEVIKIYNERQEQKKLAKLESENPLRLDEDKQNIS